MCNAFNMDYKLSSLKNKVVLSTYINITMQIVQIYVPIV